MTEQSERSAQSVLVRADVSWLGALASIVTVLIVTVIAPPLVFDAWTPRIAVILLVGPLGLVLLVTLSASRDAAAAVLVAFIGWMLLSGLLSDGPRAALVGTVGRDLSALTVACSAGLWAIGRFLTPRDRQVLGVAFVGAASFTAFVAVVQVMAQVDRGPLALLGGRPAGTLTNPVYLGAIASAAAIEAVRLAESSRWSRVLLGLSGLLGAAVSLSGSRAAAGSLILVAVGWVAYRRRRAWVGATLPIVGLAVGVVIDRVVGTGSNAADRLASTTTSGRTEVWRYGMSAWLERPVLGYGMGRFRPAVQSRFSPEFVRDFARSDVTQAWFDPHNVFVTLLVSVGVIGTGLALGFVALAVRKLNVAPALLLVPLVLHWLLQPVSLFVLPIAMLFLGAASLPEYGSTPDGSARATETPRGPSKRWSAGLLGVGAALALGIVGGDALLAVAISRGDGDLAARVATASGDDPVVSDVTAQILAISGGTDGLSEAERWQQRAAATEPDRPYWWTRLAETRFTLEDWEGVLAAAEEANRLQPFNLRAWAVRAALARETNDEEAFTEATRVLCELDVPVACDAQITDSP